MSNAGYADQHIRNDIHLGFKQFRATGIPRYQKPKANLTGTFLTTPTEAEVVTGGQTIICTLLEGEFLPSGTLFNASRQALIDGLSAAESESTGWNAEVRDNAAVTTMVRTSAKVVTFTIPASASYAIDANENLTWTIPASALAGGGDPVVADETVTIVAS